MGLNPNIYVASALARQPQTTQTAGNRHLSHLGDIRELGHGGYIIDEGQLTHTAIGLLRA